MRELRTTEKLIITVAPTRAFQRKESNPNLPTLPEEIAQSVYESWNEGASIVHIDARDKKTHRSTTEPEVLREVDAQMRGKNCDIIIQHNTANDMLIQNVQGIREIPRVKRIKAIETNPEMASLDITMAGMVTFGGKENVFVARLSDSEYGPRSCFWTEG
jgi:uncharacterized protein (DUF849 family)